MEKCLEENRVATRSDVVTKTKLVLKDIKIEIDHCSDEIRDGLRAGTESYKARRDSFEAVYRWVVGILVEAQKLPVADPDPSGPYAAPEEAPSKEDP